METKYFTNPFRPGAGHTPPYLAGRAKEKNEMGSYLEQQTITQNIILTGLRGVGKTVLLEDFKPVALSKGWQWANSDLSESTSVSESNIATRILTDLSMITSEYSISINEDKTIGFFSSQKTTQSKFDFNYLSYIYHNTPGLVSDKLKTVIEISWNLLKSQSKIKGIVFAYDEAQNLDDHSQDKQYPLSLLLEVFQSIQRKGIPFLLILTGLPTLFSKLVEARTYAERMFHIIQLNQLDKQASRDAILKPVEDSKCPIKFDDNAVELIIQTSGGYPYFIQYICKEIYDSWIIKIQNGETPSVPIDDIVRKLDEDFFLGRWNLATDRQREILKVISLLKNCDHEFSVQEISKMSKQKLQKAFSPSHVSQMLSSLSKNGLIFKNRFGKYSLAVPLLSQFIKRQEI